MLMPALLLLGVAEDRIVTVEISHALRIPQFRLGVGTIAYAEW